MVKTINKKYVPKGLTKKDKEKQLKSIKEGKDRPKVDSFKSKRSGWVSKFETKYKHKITDTDWIDKNLMKEKGQKEVIAKGMAAYYSSGSRPNQTPFSWGLARLGSVLLGGKARQVDKAIWDKFKTK